MSYLILKAALSGILIMVISEVARRNPGLGGLIASLPLLSIIAMIWMWRETHDVLRIADHAQSTFWYVLPSLPLFLILPLLLRSNVAFWIAMTIAIALTVGLYATAIWLLPKAGVNL